MGKTVVVKITTQDVVHAQHVLGFKGHRELVQKKFLELGYIVCNFNELKYLDPNNGFKYIHVEGDVGRSLMVDEQSAGNKFQKKI